MASARPKLKIFREAKVLYELLRTGAIDENFDKDLAALPTNIDRFNKLYQLMKKGLEMECKTDYDFKKDDSAKSFIEEGEEFFQDEDMLGAIVYFNKCLMFARTKEVMALAYAKRSEVLYRCKMGPQCISDINRALESNCPDDLKKDLISRLEKAKALKPSKSHPLEMPSIDVTEKNKKIQSAADCIKVAATRKFGRHIVATRDLAIGEVIMVEQPFVAIMTENNPIHCYECFKLCYNIIPCNNCTKVVYCGVECRTKAEDYHKYVCVIRRKIDILTLGRDLSPSTVLTFKLTFLMRQHLGKMESFPKSPEFYRSDRYNEIYNLNNSLNCFNNHHLIKTLLYPAVYFYYVLKTYTDFFDVGDDPEAAEEDFKRLMILHGGIVQINMREGSELGFVNGFLAHLPVFYGVYSAMSLFNHACSNNVTNIAHGKMQVLRVSRTIKKGEQCFINYGMRYDKVTLSVRRERLQGQYYMQCTCEACTDNWLPVNYDTVTIRGNELSLRIFRSTDIQWIKKHLKTCMTQVRSAEKRIGSEDFIISSMALQFCMYAFGNVRPLLGPTSKY